MKSRLTALIAVIAFAAVTVAAGCGSSNNDHQLGDAAARRGPRASFSVQPDPAIVAQVPAKSVKSSGNLTVAADATYAPDEFIAPDGKRTVIGMDADMAKAIAQVMGLQGGQSRTSRSTASFPASPRAGTTSVCPHSRTPRTARKRWTSSRKRKRGHVVYLAASGGPETGQILDDLCGQKVGAEKGTTRAMMRPHRREAAGKSPGVTLRSSRTRTASTWRFRAVGRTFAMADTPGSPRTR